MRRNSTKFIRNAYGVGQTRYPASDGDQGWRSGRRLGGRIQAIREHLGLTKTAFAERIGVSQPTVTRWELEQDIPDERHLQRLAAMIQISVPELRYGRAGLSEPVPVVGYVGPEAVVAPLRPERGESELEQVTALPGLDDRNVLALRVRGDGVGPMLREGWLVFYRRPENGVPDDCIGEVCVVCLTDGRLLLRELRLTASSDDGPARFNLHGIDGKNGGLPGQSVAWAARVLGFRAP